MKGTSLIILLLLLCGCGMDYHLRKANFHLRLAQAKGAVVKTDTVWKTISYTVATKVYDTVVMHDRDIDTLVITNTKYSIKLKYDTITKNQYVRVECKGDTVFVKVPVSTPIIIEDPKRIGFEWVFVILFLVLITSIWFYQKYRSEK